MPATMSSARRPAINRPLAERDGQTIMSIEEMKYVEDRGARKFYGPVLVIGYVVLLALTIFVPIVVFVGASMSGSGEQFATGLKSIQDFIVAMLAGLAGLSGLAGLVVGRFFQAEAARSPDKTFSPRRQPRQKLK